MSYLILFVMTASGSFAAEMRLAVTTSFNNSGLSDVLLPNIKMDLDLDVQLLVVGTGQALKLGRAGDVDAVLVHSRKAEEEFVDAGYGTHRREIMYNDFVLIGPKDDPAGVARTASIVDALKLIESATATFVSRGDDSGTHRRERELWVAAELLESGFDESWYKSVGVGMGAALNTATGLNAYVLSDRASWSKFGNKGDLELLLSGDPLLFNQYSYLPVNQERHPHIKSEEARLLENWLVSDRGQQLIGGYKIDGKNMFIPNATFQ
jgi:tungstate transport system substrate-binding protein